LFLANFLFPRFGQACEHATAANDDDLVFDVQHGHVNHSLAMSSSVLVLKIFCLAVMHGAGHQGHDALLAPSALGQAMALCHHAGGHMQRQLQQALQRAVVLVGH
jgi:hypothetical protein